MDYSDDLPIFEYEYQIGGATEHHTGYCRPMTNGAFGDDPLRVLPAIVHHITTGGSSRQGIATTGGTTLEKRAFQAPTGLPQTVFTNGGFLDTSQEFAVSYQQSHWYQKDHQNKFHNLTLGIEGFDYDRIGEDDDLFQHLLLERGRWAEFEEWYHSFYASRPVKGYRTLLVYRAKYDLDEHANFSTDVVVGGLPTDYYVDGDYTGTTDDNIYEVFYSANTSPLKYDDHVLKNVGASDTKSFAVSPVPTGGSESWITHPTQTRPDTYGSGLYEFQDALRGFHGSRAELPSPSWGDPYYDETIMAVEVDMDPAGHGDGTSYVTTYEYQTERLREAIQIRYQIQSGHQFAVKEVSDEFFGALMKQLAIQVGVDTIPRAYATKMQATNPLKMNLLSSMQSETSSTGTPSGTTPSTAMTTATTTGGSY